MGFDLNGFQQAKLVAREASVPVPGLAAFFDGEALWRVRGLSGAEVARADAAAQASGLKEATIEALAGTKAEKVKAMRELLGLAGEVPRELAKRLEHLVAGSVEPVLELSDAVRLAEHYPVEFYQLTNKIVELTGLGSEPGKPAASTAKQKSRPR